MIRVKACEGFTLLFTTEHSAFPRTAPVCSYSHLEAHSWQVFTTLLSGTAKPTLCFLFTEYISYLIYSSVSLPIVFIPQVHQQPDFQYPRITAYPELEGARKNQSPAPWILEYWIFAAWAAVPRKGQQGPGSSCPLDTGIWQWGTPCWGCTEHLGRSRDGFGLEGS